MFTEDEIRVKFEQNYLSNNKHAKTRNEHGEYVNAYTQDAWSGFKGAFELMEKVGFGHKVIKTLMPNIYNKPVWIPSPESSSDLNIPGFSKLLYSYNKKVLYVYTGDGDGSHKLLEMGFEIIDSTKEITSEDDGLVDQEALDKYINDCLSDESINQ